MQSTPLRRHFAHFCSPATDSHRILCLLHSTPIVANEYLVTASSECRLTCSGSRRPWSLRTPTRIMFCVFVRAFRHARVLPCAQALQPMLRYPEPVVGSFPLRRPRKTKFRCMLMPLRSRTRRARVLRFPMSRGQSLVNRPEP